MSQPLNHLHKHLPMQAHPYTFSPTIMDPQYFARISPTTVDP